MNYREARGYLERLSAKESVMGLEPIRELLRRLGNPQNQLKFIHIAGTNGKGSVLAFVSSVLREAHYKTGCYISPTLISYRERIQVNGEYIEKEALARLVSAIAEAAASMEKEGLASPTVFEQETALAFLYFAERKCDLVVLETGMGGRLDATNVVTATVLEILASIGMDHMSFLGNTLAEIAENKAGIIKPGTRVVSARQEPEAEAVIKRICEQEGCTLTMVQPEKLSDISYGIERQCFSYKSWKNMQISLAGSYQIINAALALEALEALRGMEWEITSEQVYRGMEKAQWRGRFTVLRKNPLVLVDGAHNPAAARVLRESVKLYFPGKRLIFILGVFEDKDYKGIIQLMAPLAYHIFTVQTPDNPRAMNAEKLRDEVKSVNPCAEACESIGEAVKKSLAMAEKEDVILAFGSLSYLSKVESAL